MSTAIRFVATTGMTSLTLKLYALDVNDLPTGSPVNGAGDAVTEVDTTIYEATVAEALLDWHWVDVLYDSISIVSGYVQMTALGGEQWIRDTPVAGVAPATNVMQSTGYMTCYDEEGVVEEGVEIDVRQTDASQTSGYAFDNAVRTEISDANGLVTIDGMWRGATYRMRRGDGRWLTCVVPDSAIFELPVVLGMA